jgi:hypothetical protein
MGFYTTFQIAYPQEPRAVTGELLAKLINDIVPLCSPSSLSLSLKFGDSAATSHAPFFSIEPTETPGIGISVTNYDLEKYPKSLSELLDELNTVRNRGIHRALISFASLSEEVSSKLQRHPGPLNEEGLYPYDIGLALGPIDAESNDDNFELVQIGWVKFSISGNGYCYPWTHQEFSDRCLSIEISTAMRNSLLSHLGPPGASSPTWDITACSKRTRQLPDGLIAAVRGI